ncbi:MAG: CoA pyrophosphatase [Chloroflexota bacterium]|nr:CoA pyrophosphatase [Chloroflexota bacterium]
MTLDEVRRALALPRPGRPAHVRMSPRPRPGDIFPLPPEIQPKEAGVLILLFPRDQDLSFFLTRRTDTVENHKGQISLPGGAQEAGESLSETARRETCEELNIDPAGLGIIDGPLTPVYIPVSGFRATPFVAYTPARPRVSAEPGEVGEIIDTSLELIVDEKNVAEEEWEIRGYKGIVPFFNVNGHKVWGATAMVLGEFAEMLRRAKAGGQVGVSATGEHGAEGF